MARRGHAAPLRADRRDRVDGPRDAPTRSSRSSPGCASTGSSATSSATCDHVPPPEPGRPRIVAFLGGTIGNFPPGSRRRFLRAMARLLRPGVDHLLLGHRPRQGPGGARGRLRRRGGRDRRVQPQRPARGQPRARRGLRRRRLRARRLLRPRARVDRDAPARAAAHARPRRRARARRRVRRARGAAHRDQREVHAASAWPATSPPRASRSARPAPTPRTVRALAEHAARAERRAAHRIAGHGHRGQWSARRRRRVGPGRGDGAAPARRGARR